MNKRIEELADRLWRIQPSDINAMGLETRKEFYEHELKKFAELIVQSIADIDFRYEIGLTSDQVFAIRNLIKNHFKDEQ